MAFRDQLAQINSPITLYPHQVRHVSKIWESMMVLGEMCYIDTSRTGLGKTHVALEIGFRLEKLFGIPLAIIGANRESLENDDGWNNWVKNYGNTVVRSTTYHSIRRVPDEWLYKDKDGNYHASEKFRLIAKKGIFLIFDEFDMATRKSATHKACAALVRECSRNPTRCRIALLSFTPGDKYDHYPQILRLTGLISSFTIVENIPFTSLYKWEEHGLGEMVNECILRGADKNTILADFGAMSMRRSKIILSQLYDTYIRKRICHAMPVPDIENKLSMKNSYIKCYPSDLEPLNDSISRLCDGVSWDGYNVGEKKQWNLGQINIALRLIERYKLRSIARYIKKRLSENPAKKFVVSMGARGSEHFQMMREILSSMKVTTPIGTLLMIQKARNDITNPWHMINSDTVNIILEMAYKPPVDIMNGNTKPKDRLKILSRFQAEHSDSWCLLISPGVGGKSISLHDKHGNHPREIIIIPDHFHSRITQTTGRTNRVGVKSDVDITMLYCKETRKEMSILDCMNRKSEVAKKMLAEGQDHVFPGDFDIYIEN